MNSVFYSIKVKGNGSGENDPLTIPSETVTVNLVGILTVRRNASVAVCLESS